MKWLIAGMVLFLVAMVGLMFAEAMWWKSYSLTHNCEATGQNRITYIPIVTCSDKTCWTTITPIVSYEFHCNNGTIWR